MSVLSKKYFHNEAAAFAHLEAILWASGVACPHCGAVDRASKMEGKSTRLGLWKCYECRKQFTVKVGTVFEAAHIPLHKMLQAVYLMSSSKKGVSAHQLHRTLEITYKSAWFLAHRIREAMSAGKLTPMGGEGSIVEADETYFGKKDERPTVTTSGRPFLKGGMGAHKISIVSLVERNGSVRSFHVDGTVNAQTVSDILSNNVKPETVLHTDESKLYVKIGKEYASHDTVNHGAKEYARGIVHTNTIEGYFSIFKRGMKGVYQHCREKHLHRYLAEFDFRYNNRVAVGVDDQSRTENALMGIVGKRLKYRQPPSLT